MSETQLVRRVALFSAIAAISSCSVNSSAVTIVSGPDFAGATNAPLAGVLKLTTDVASTIRVSVNDGAKTWERQFYDYGTTHSIPLLGFKPGSTNKITAIVSDRNRNRATASPLTFITNPLPGDFPTIVLLESKPDKMAPGYTLCRLMNGSLGTDYLTIVNSSGEVVWYSGNSSNLTSFDVRQLENGDLFFPSATGLVEINMLGETIKSWAAADSLPLDIHDGVPTDHGTILYLSVATRSVANFPSSTTDPSAPLTTANVSYNKVVEISASDGALLNTWSLIDMLDPTRIDYTARMFSGAWDVEHANAVIEDPKDDSIIVSLRNQDAVIKFFRATGKLKWILGPHENWPPEFQPYLLTPVGTSFQWNYAQHAPMLTPQGTLLLYDNGNYRASPFDAFVSDQSNYSRAVEFQIDEERMEVSQVWEYGAQAGERLFTGSVGDANWLPQRQNILITFGTVAFVNGVHPSPLAPNAFMARIKEVTHDPIPEVVFDLAVFDYANTSPSYRGYWVYRSIRITDLYPPPRTAASDLALKFGNGTSRLEFSADVTRTYYVEASTDLMKWQEIGEAMLEDSGDFSFADEAAAGFSARYYRVITK